MLAMPTWSMAEDVVYISPAKRWKQNLDKFQSYPCPEWQSIKIIWKIHKHTWKYQNHGISYHSISQHVGQSSLQVSSRTTSSKWIGKFTSAVCTRAPTVQPKNWSLKQPMTMSRALASKSASCCYDHEQPSVAKLYAYATYIGKHIGKK